MISRPPFTARDYANAAITFFSEGNEELALMALAEAAKLEAKQ